MLDIFAALFRWPLVLITLWIALAIFMGVVFWLDGRAAKRELSEESQQDGAKGLGSRGRHV